MEDNTVVVEWQDIGQQLQNAFTLLETGFFSLLLRPWGQFQIALLILIFVAAHFLARSAEPRFEDWLRNTETTRQRLRTFAVFLRRLRLTFFILGAWTAVGVVRTVTWPSRSYLVGVVASIATVWLAVSLIGKLVRNRLAAKTLTVTVWVIAALYILGLLPITIAVLDAAAISAGELRVSLLLLVKAAIVLAALLWTAALISRVTERRIQRIEDISPSMRVLTGKLIRVGLFTVAVMVGLQSIGFNLTGLTVFSGAIGLGIGFGLQKVVSNLISGVILLLDRSIKPGDVIEVGNTFGWISTLGGRYVSVVTRDGREYLIPNEDLITNQVINWSHTNPMVRLEVPFGVSYESDPHVVRKIAVEAAVQPQRVLATPAPVCHLTAYGDFSIDFVLRFWIADPGGGVINVKGEVLLALWDALKENNIEIPYPRREIEISEPVRLEIAPGGAQTALRGSDPDGT